MLGNRQAPHDLPPAFFAMVLSQLIESSNDPNKPTFKKLQARAEDILAKNVYTNLDKMTPEAKARFATFLALFLSQIDGGKDLRRTEPLLLKLTEHGQQGQVTESQKAFLQEVFAQLCMFCQPKRVKEQLDA